MGLGFKYCRRKPWSTNTVADRFPSGLDGKQKASGPFPQNLDGKQARHWALNHIDEESRSMVALLRKITEGCAFEIPKKGA
jgi:hypothetical protein